MINYFFPGTKLKCPFCERTYGYETNLRAHIRQRHQGIRVPCPYCHRTFTRNNTVRRHIAREHRGQVNPKMIPAKFGQTKVLPDQPYLDTINALHLSSQQPWPLAPLDCTTTGNNTSSNHIININSSRNGTPAGGIISSPTAWEREAPSSSSVNWINPFMFHSSSS